MEFSDCTCREFMEKLPEAVFLETLDGDILEVNKEACDLLGYEREELLELTVDDLVPEGAPASLSGWIDEAARKGKPLETVNLSKDGTEVPVELRGKIVDIEDEERMLVSIRDISERRQAKKEHQIVTEGASQAIYLFQGGKFKFVNESFEKLSGYSKDELNDIGYLQLVHPDYREKVAEWNRQALAGDSSGLPERVEYKVLTKEGETKWVRSLPSLIEYEGRPAIVGNAVDITGEKKLEENLKQYKMAVESSVNLLAAVDENYKYLFANEAYRKLYQAKDENVVGKKMEDIVGEETFTGEIKPRIDRCFQGEKVDYEMSRTQSGEGERVLSIAYYPLEHKNEIHGAVKVMRDITECKRAERKLKQSEERLELALEGTKAGIWDWNVQTGEVVLSERWAEILGYTLEELQPVTIKTWKELTHPEDLKRSEELLDKHFSGEAEIYECETRMKHKNGDWVWVLDRGHVVKWSEEGEPIRMVGTHQDITERKEAEQELEQKERLLSQTEELTKVGGWEYDAEEDKIYWTDYLFDLHGFSKEEKGHIEKSLQCYPPEAREKIENAFRKAVEEGKPYDLEIPFFPEDGEERWVRTTGRPVIEGGEVKRVIGNFVDITEKKRTEETLQEERNKLKHLHEAVDELQKQETEGSILRTAVEVSEDILDFEHCAIDLIKGDYIVTKAISSGLSPEQTHKYEIGEGIGGITVERGETIWGDDLRNHPKAKPASNDFRAFISAPIGEVGVFQVVSLEVGSFDEEDVELAEILANHLQEEIKRVRVEEDLHQQAIRDPLTDLYNRRYFNETLEEEVERCKRYDRPVAFLMADVNRFKEINDRYTHQLGDEVLQEVANLLKKDIRDADTVVRYGGDEFLIMMPETNGELKNVTERLKENLARWNEKNDLLDFPLTLAMGVSHWSPSQDRDVEEALKEADGKMYEDKRENG